MKAAVKRPSKKKASPPPAAKPAVRGPTSASATFSTATNQLCKLYPVAAEYLHDLDPALRLPTQQAYSVLRDGRSKFLHNYYDLGRILESVQSEFKNGGVVAMHAVLLKIDPVNGPGIDILYHVIRFARMCDQREADRLFAQNVAWGSVRHLITVEDPAARRDLTDRMITEKWSTEQLEQEIKQLRGNGQLAGGRAETDNKLGRAFLTPGPVVGKFRKLSEQTKRLDGLIEAMIEPMDIQLEELKVTPVTEWPDEVIDTSDILRKQLRQLQDRIALQLQKLDSWAVAVAHRPAVQRTATAAKQTPAVQQPARVVRPPRAVSKAGSSR